MPFTASLTHLSIKGGCLQKMHTTLSLGEEETVPVNVKEESGKVFARMKEKEEGSRGGRRHEKEGREKCK